MPARVAVLLAAETSGALPPPQTGPAVAAAVLAAVGAVDPALAQQLHDAPPPKPYRLTPLLDENDRPPRRDSREVRFEVGILVDALFARIYQALSAERTWRIGQTTYQAVGVEIRALAEYPGLASAAAPATSWAFRLVTPCAFGTAREEGARRQRVFPEPEWVFTSLANRWRAYAGELRSTHGGVFDLEGAVVAAERNLEVVEADLRTAEHLVKPRVPPVRGSVGAVRYSLAEAGTVSPDARHALDTLATFACYAGLGDRTGVGMGHVVPLPAAAPTRRQQPSRAARTGTPATRR
ncbi:CRISPR-associated endoribonuclease Cas6 [Pseudofrankia sp. BMG5.37]|uniref:CRISPR-associated endoribonuclease Cas6 n=1 Tax=Pseudofrankia sp. BMG5.37 TaxID=3050035 RepID=UPI002894473A|nr:CRISPR-associated endoribonuclease Cas6 [Pseudofrankia sp. BMG5.37]MDT3440474.1 CRISPR-associated endoribonuclease Cas6 [Pseudofrankia sp. BMG5.37]